MREKKRKRRCNKIMIALLAGVFMAGTVFCMRMYQLTKIVYANSTEDELAEELYFDSLEMCAVR